ncbi:KH domain-containing protein [Cyclospora cayetanensis]|uniref:KH domain-containing protein n=1 Tax=Cyclospora cayetanensis TaxID=88456 RepID=A0A1D3D6V1_9EIME|nr:KH domain-containing protein [Cyclospora cayetanensis]
MARKKRTDEEAAAGSAAAAAAGIAKQSGENVSKGSDAGRNSDGKGGAVAEQGRPRKGGEGASRQGGTPNSAAAPPETDTKASVTAATPKSFGSAAKEQADQSGGAAAAAAENTDAVVPPLGVAQRREIDMTGMSASRKKNLKKKIRKQEQRQQEAELNSAMRAGAGGSTYASRLSQIAQQWSKQVAQLEASCAKVTDGAGAKRIAESAAQLQKEMQEVQEEEVAGAKMPINKRSTVQHMQEKIKEAEQTIQKQQKEQQRAAGQQNKHGAEVRGAADATSDAQLEESLRYLAHLREQLALTQQQSDLRAFQQQAAELKATLEQIVRSAHKAVQQAANAPDNRRAQQREATWHKRLQEVGAAFPEANGVSSFVNASVALPSDASFILLTPQGQPSPMLRKVERKFSVLVEKKGLGDRGLLLSIVGYVQDACDKCAAFLNACNFPQVPIGFSTAPNCISLEGQNIGAFIGSAGSNLRKLEAELDVLLWLEDKWITILGHEATVKKAIPQIKYVCVLSLSQYVCVLSLSQRLWQSQCRCEFKSEVARAMIQGSARTRSKVQDIETAMGVTILVRLPRRGDLSKTTTVAIRGASADECKKACAELEEVFGGFGVEVVECDRFKATRILRGTAVDFSHIRSHELISLLRCDEGVLLVAPSEALRLAVEAVEAAMHQLSRATEVLEIKATQLRILDRGKRNEIETLSGATCKPPLLDGEKATLTFTGHPDAVQKAVEMAQQILDEMKEEELELSVAAALCFLADKAHRALEEEHGIRIRVDVPRERLIVRGSLGGYDVVADAIKRMEDEVARSGKVAHKIEVPREAVPAILGRQGANVRRLQSDCNLDSVVIDGRPQAVYLLGSQEAIDQAVVMVQEIVGNSTGTRAQNGVDGGDLGRRPRAVGGRGGGRGGRGDGVESVDVLLSSPRQSRTMQMWTTKPHSPRSESAWLDLEGAGRRGRRLLRGPRHPPGALLSTATVTRKERSL